MKDQFEYNNEEEAEMAQIHSLHIHQNAVDKARLKIAEQERRASLFECEDCGEPIPERRRLAILGVTKCVFCQEEEENLIKTMNPDGPNEEIDDESDES